MWIAQRLWLAGIAAAAGIGILRLCQRIGVGSTGALVAAIAYQFTPYQLAFTARFSALLLPWAALPWLVLLTAGRSREPGWRAPVAFGLVASTAGAVNASSLVLVLIAPGFVVVDAALAPEGRRPSHRGRGTAWRGDPRRVRLVDRRHRGPRPLWPARPAVDRERRHRRRPRRCPDDIIRGLGNWIFTSTDGATDRPRTSRGLLGPPRHPTGHDRTSRPGRRRAHPRPAVEVGRCSPPSGPAPPSSESAPRHWATRARTASCGGGSPSTARSDWPYGTRPGSDRCSCSPRGLALAFGIDHFAAGHAPAPHWESSASWPSPPPRSPATGSSARTSTDPNTIPEYWHQLAADLDASPPTVRASSSSPGPTSPPTTWGNTSNRSPGTDRPPNLATRGAAQRRSRHHRPPRCTGSPAPTRPARSSTLAPVARLLGVGDVVIRGDIDAARFGLTDPLRARPPTSSPTHRPGFDRHRRYGGSAAGTPVLLRLSLDDPPRCSTAGRSRCTGAAGRRRSGIIDAAQRLA